MRSCLFILVGLLCFYTKAIAQRNKHQIDSLKYYREELTFIKKEYQDSLQLDPQFQKINAQVNRLRAESDNYKGFILYTCIYSADFTKFNSDNSLSNFGPFSEPMIGIGYGFTFKKNRRIFDLNAGAIGLSKKVNKENEYIKMSFSSFLQLEWGYDFIKSNALNIYPYAGIGLRSSTLKYKAPAATNVTHSNITDIIQNNKSIDEYVTEIGYQAGIGLEFVVSKKTQPGGILLFMKGGTNMPFKRKTFSIEGVQYDPNFRYGDLTLSAGFKFFGR